jgi:hypothetical protein
MYARIYKERKSVTQSAPFDGKWILEFIPNPEGIYVSSTMNWNASTDVKKQIKLKFDTADEAKKYAATHGVTIVFESEESLDTKKIRKKSYLENFK